MSRRSQHSPHGRSAIRAWAIGSDVDSASATGTSDHEHSTESGLSPFLSSKKASPRPTALASSVLQSLPRLDLDAIGSGFSSSRASSALTSLGSSDHRPSLTIQVMADPDAVPEGPVIDQDAGKEDEIGGAELDGENDGALTAEGASAAADAPEVTLEASPEAVPADASRAAAAPSSDGGQKASGPGMAAKPGSGIEHGRRGSNAIHMDIRQAVLATALEEQTAANLKNINRYYQNKELMSPRKAAAAAAARAAKKGDLAAHRQALKEAQESKSAVMQARREDRRRLDAIRRIQARERGRRAVQYVRVLRLQAWAVNVVQRGLLMWRRRCQQKAEEATRKIQEGRLRAERRQAEAAAREVERARRREEELREAFSKEAEENRAPGASRRRAKRAGDKDQKLKALQQQKQRDKIKNAAQEAVKQAEREAQELQQAALAKHEEERLKHQKQKAERQEAKLQMARNVVAQQQAAREEALAVVRAFAEGMQHLASAGADRSEDIRIAGGIPPLVAMLSSTMPVAIESAAAAALTHVSQASELNRVAVRKAGGFQPLIGLATATAKTGTMKYVPALTHLSMGTNPANQNAIRKGGGIPVLVGLLPGGSESPIACQACAALRQLTWNNRANCEAVREAEGLKYLVAFLQGHPEQTSVQDAVIALAQISNNSQSCQDGIREAGGIRPLIGLLSGNPESMTLQWAARCLARLAQNNSPNRNAICDLQGTIARLVALLGVGVACEAAKQASEVLYALMVGNDEKIASAVLAQLRRQGVGMGPNASFSLGETFPSLLEGLKMVVSNRLQTALNEAAKKGSERASIQSALNDAIALELPEEQLESAKQRLDFIAAARAEAIAARKARGDRKKAQKEKEKAAKAAAEKAAFTSKEAVAAAPGAAPSADAAAKNNAATSGALLMLREAQSRLRELELASLEARRARRDAAQERSFKGLTLSPDQRREYTQSFPGAADRVAAAANHAESAARREFEFHDDEHDEGHEDLGGFS